MNEKELLVEKYRCKRNTIHLYWSIGVLIFILIIILSYKFWGKSGSLENLISIGSGLVSMTLALVAIFITLSEGIKTSNKEARLDVTLSEITLNTKKTEDILNKIQPKVDNIDLKTGTFEINLANMAKGYNDAGILNKDAETPSKDAETPSKDAETPSKDASKLQSHFGSGDNIGRDKIKQEPRTDTTSLSGKVATTSNVTGEVTVRQERIFKGKVYVADLNPVVGNEQGGTRPVIIVSNEVFNKYSSLVTIVPVTLTTSKIKIPTLVSLGFSLNPDREAFAMVEHIRTVDRSRLSELVASLDEDTLTKIDHAIDVQMGMHHTTL